MNHQVYEHCWLLQHSFEKLVGKPLVSPRPLSNEALYHALYHAPFALVSHNAEADPIFNFANTTAQQLWEMDWQIFTSLPSRLSAEPINQTEREQLLQMARTKGYIDGYKGIRISQSGKRFYIQDTILWNITDPQGMYYGQAAMFHKWQWL